MLARRRGRVIKMVGGGTGNSFPHGSGYATSKAGLLRLTEWVSDTLADSGVRVFAMDPGLVRTAMTEFQLTSDDGRRYLTDISHLFDEGVNVSPTLAGRLSIEIAQAASTSARPYADGGARDLDLDEAAIDAIVAADLRSLRVNGMPQTEASR